MRKRPSEGVQPVNQTSNIERYKLTVYTNIVERHAVSYEKWGRKSVSALGEGRAIDIADESVTRVL